MELQDGGRLDDVIDKKNVQRTAKVERTTHETLINVNVNIDGSGQTLVKTGLPFIDHLITSFGKHSMLDIDLKAKSKDGIVHHLIEDASIALSVAIDKALADRLQITRFGYSLVPMDECLSYAAIDLIKRQFHNIQLKLTREYGDNDHHKVESAIKAFAVALRMAVSIDKKRTGTPSTKGAI
jgi:imidazoleglycerol-phosphate dehydratase